MAKSWRGFEMPSLVWHLRTWEDFKNTSWFTKGNYLNIILLVVFLFLAIRQVRAKQKEAEKAGFAKRYLKADGFPEIKDQSGFDWKSTEPLQFRPFKPKYHLTMAESDDSAIENLDPNDLLTMDKTYADRIAYRRKIMSEHGKHVVNVHDEPRARPAVVELYRFLMGQYLPLRYPGMFKLHETEYDGNMTKTYMLENFVTKAMFPANVTVATPTERILETLGRTVDEDFLFLLPEEDVEDPKYVLHAHVVCCPSGFDLVDKIGKRLAAIHEPVPGYAQKLEGSMDKFFAKVEVGKYVKRVNWSISTTGELYSAASGSMHAKEGDDIQQMEEIDVDKTFVRCERQTLHRLPNTQAIVFAFKTYLYPIKDIKEEGLGEELAAAIDGMKEGSVPGMHFYKRAPVWGEALKRYLRS